MTREERFSCSTSFCCCIDAYSSWNEAAITATGTEIESTPTHIVSVATSLPAVVAGETSP